MRRGCLYLVLMVLPTLARAVGWTPEVWDRTNTWDEILTTNLVAISVVDIISQVSTGAIPEIGEFAGYWKFGEHATNNTRTNAYYIEVGTETSLIGYSSNSVLTNITGAVTTTVTRTETGGVYSFKLDVDDRRALEVYWALYERDTGTNGWLRFYHSDRENLMLAKNMLALMPGNFVDILSTWTNPNASTVVWSNWFEVETDTDIWNETPPNKFATERLFAAISVPSNYLTYTPYKFNTLGGVVTQSWEIIPYSGQAGPIYTNKVWLYTNVSSTLKGLVEISGTSGAPVSIVTTNPLVQDGFVNADYGWWFMTNIMAALVVRSDSLVFKTIDRERKWLFFDCDSPSFWPNFADYYSYTQLDSTNYFVAQTNAEFLAGFHHPDTNAPFSCAECATITDLLTGIIRFRYGTFYGMTDAPRSNQAPKTAIYQDLRYNMLNGFDSALSATNYFSDTGIPINTIANGEPYKLREWTELAHSLTNADGYHYAVDDTAWDYWATVPDPSTDMGLLDQRSTLEWIGFNANAGAGLPCDNFSDTSVYLEWEYSPSARGWYIQDFRTTNGFKFY
jgi:hypothetical protein